MIASNNGLTVIGTRIVSGKPGDINPAINSIILLRIIHGAAAWLILTIIFYFIYGLNELFFALSIYLCYLIPSALIIEWFFQGKEQMLIISAGRIISIAGYLIFLYFFVTTKEQLILTPVGFVLGAGINALFLVIMFYLSGQRLRFRFMFRQIKTLWFQSIPLSLSSSLSQFVLQLPPVLLAMLCSFESVGIYSVAFRLISIILVFDRLLSFLFFPAVCRWIQFKVDLKEYLKRSVRIVIAFSFMVTLIFLLLAKTIVELTFGESYRESVLVFQILTGYACLTFINTIFSYTLIALKKENVYLRSLIWGGAGFILCLISLSGSMGEAAPAVGLIVFDFVSLLIMNQNLKQWISVKTSMIITILLVFTFLLAWPLLLIFNFPIYMNFVIAFFIIIPLIKMLTSIRISDLMYLKKITI
jgi:O-antigen/teichoic acid export membrane protein